MCLLSGTGAVVAAVEAAIGRSADVVCGKPHAPIFDVTMELHKLDPKRTVMIGDR